MRIFIATLIVGLYSGFGVLLPAQADTTEVRPCVEAVHFTGNDRTHISVLEREMTFREGACFEDHDAFQEAIRNTTRNLENTKLFVEVHPETQVKNNTYEVTFDLRERWYVFPEPTFELSDRNFNEWWETYNRDFSRVTYGLRVTDYNFRGRREELRIIAEGGFSRYFRFSYKMPGLDRSRNWGLETHFSLRYHTQTEVNTIQNRLQFEHNDQLLHREGRAFLALLYRPGYYMHHRFEAGVDFHRVSNDVIEANPRFFHFNEESNRHTFVRLLYEGDYDRRDHSAYPTSGYRLKGTTELKALGEDFSPMLRIAPEAEWYRPLPYNFYLATGLRGAVNFPDELPWFHRETLGYGRAFVRGYEPYVMDGFASTLGKIELKNRIFSHRFNLESMVPLRQFQIIPVDVYLKGHADAGYIHDNLTDPFNNTLKNTPLFGYGVGIDVVTAYDKVLRLEYSFRKAGQSGLFLHLERGI